MDVDPPQLNYQYDENGMLSAQPLNLDDLPEAERERIKRLSREMMARFERVLDEHRDKFDDL